MVSALEPVLEFVKNSKPQGIFDYQIICDERNNKPDTIDQNNLVVDILIQPTRSAEFVLVNFGVSRTCANFSEMFV